MGDELLIVIIIGFFTVTGGMVAAFMLLWNELDFVPRKYWDKVYIKRRVSTDGNLPTLQRVKSLKGWIVNRKGIPYFRVGMGFLKGVDFDKGIMECFKDGELDLIEKIDGLKEASNYTPEHIPITDQEGLLEEISDRLSRRVQNEDGTETLVPIDEPTKAIIRQMIVKHSKLDDLKQTSWVAAHVDQNDKQANRVKKDDILKDIVMPIIIVLVVCLFGYLIFDTIGKTYVAVTKEATAPVVMMCEAQIKACGGIPPNMTAPQTSGGLFPLTTK